ncbi:Arm repeat-containing protein [Elysia marginata]|uniref:Arm repeat-containing protein n=1 Tax=Elysia marginata TaxID=1093978 RepID=A0AAV4JSL5_9GAST|nr:Arm repeat-containing protein [Elysia marginata]
MATYKECLAKLCSKAKLDRDRGFNELQSIIHQCNEDQIAEIQNEVLELLGDESSSWESKHGGLSGARCLLEQGKVDIEEDETCIEGGNPFAFKVIGIAMQMLDDEEFRVRIAAGELLGILCKAIGAEVYERCKDQMLDGIRSNLERHGLDEDSTDCQNAEPESIMYGSPATSSRLIEKRSMNTSQILHDTAGWRNLETYMKGLQSVILGCGNNFNEYVDQELLDLIFEALTHTNRFVRETGYYVCSALVTCGAKEGSESYSEATLTEENSIYRHGKTFAEYLGKGLADNWSQVRMAGSVATRKFLVSLPSDGSRQKFFPILIPRMCLNRYYVAEGVRIYSQETWKLVTKGDGKTLVETYIDDVVDYYVESTESDNHAVREAACACIAELGSKIDTSVVESHVPKLLETLLICFNDDSWPVRDAACIASGHFVLCFPEQSKSSLPALYPLFFNNLQDNIPSVRQGAAVSISNIVKAYGVSEQEVVFSKIKEGLEKIKEQKATSEKYTAMDKSPGAYSVVKQLRDNDMDLHTNQTMYSCGSLAPKMGRGGGCMDHQFRRPSEPWEFADGCVHLLAELSHIPSVSGPVGKLIPAMANACSTKDYTHYPNFLETVCKQLPNLAKGLGKRPFKMYLELFLDYIFDALGSEIALTSAAASQCLIELCHYLGPGIVRGRVEQYNSMYLNQFDGISGIPRS